MIESVNICCCHSCSPVDSRLCIELEKQLSPLIFSQQIAFWHPGKLLAGDNRTFETAFQISTADIVLLLLSPDFMSSHLCLEQMGLALTLFYQLRTRVVPILLRDILWEDTSIAHLEILPHDRKPIKSRPNRERAFLDIVRSIRPMIKKLYVSPRKIGAFPEGSYKMPFVPGLRDLSIEELKCIYEYLPTSGLQVRGKYELRELSSARGEIVSYYCPLGIPGLTPLSVSINTADTTPKNMTSPSTSRLSSGGVLIYGIHTEEHALCEVAGDIIISY